MKITELINDLSDKLQVKGINSREYYHYTANKKDIVSNVPFAVYDNLKLVKYNAPKQIDYKLDFLIQNIQNYVDFLQNHPDASVEFGNRKLFQLNHCHHNSTGIFNLIDKDRFGLSKPSQIVFGYIAQELPFGIQVGNNVLTKDAIWVHNWHIWNYVENLLVDISMLKIGLIPRGSSASWGVSRDHVFIAPPSGMEYWGVAYSNYKKFEKDFYQCMGSC